MANANSARSAARESATETKAASTKTRAPAPRDEANGTDAQTQAEAETAVVDVPLVVVSPNPKRAGTIAFRHFEFYFAPAKRGELTTLRAVQEAGVRGKDISWDADRAHILVGEEAEKFVEMNAEEKVAFLKTKNVPEKSLIKWGYMEAPKPAEPTPAEGEQSKTEEPATA